MRAIPWECLHSWGALDGVVPTHVCVLCGLRKDIGALPIMDDAIRKKMREANGKLPPLDPAGNIVEEVRGQCAAAVDFAVVEPDPLVFAFLIGYAAAMKDVRQWAECP